MDTDTFRTDVWFQGDKYHFAIMSRVHDTYWHPIREGAAISEESVVREAERDGNVTSASHPGCTMLGALVWHHPYKLLLLASYGAMRHLLPPDYLGHGSHTFTRHEVAKIIAPWLPHVTYDSVSKPPSRSWIYKQFSKALTTTPILINAMQTIRMTDDGLIALETLSDVERSFFS